MKIPGNILKIIFVWIVVFFVCFGVLEGAFRLGRMDDNPLALISQKKQDVLFEPSQSFQNRSSVPGEFDVTVHTNRFGYRGKDFVMPKPSGIIRVFAVGDSFTFGVGAADQETIPSVLEKRLVWKGISAEVVNAGIGGAGTIAHYLNIRDIHLHYQPDVVFLFFDLTDLWDDWNAERHAILDPDGEIVRFDPMFINGKRDWWTTATYYSTFLRYFHNRVVRSLLKIQVLGVRDYIKTILQGKRAKAVIATASHEKARQASIEYDGLLLMRGREREALIREHWPRTERYILKIRDLLAARGIPLVVVMYPHGIFVDGDQWKDGRKTWGFEAGKRYDDHFAFELMADLCQRAKIPFVNTLDAFLQAPKDKYFFDWDGHMTPKGNKIVASVVAKDPDVFRILSDLKKK